MAAKRTRKLLVWAFCLHSLLIFSQTTFQKTFGGPGNEVGTWILETTNGFVVAGHVTSTSGNQDALLVRLDASGNTVWQRRFGGGQSDAFYSVVATPDGGFLAAGETRSYGAGNADIFLVKVDASGTILWSKTIGDSDHDDIARSVIPVAGGGFIVSGSSALYYDMAPNSVFMRLDQNGNTLWSHTFATSISNQLYSNYIDGNVIYASGGADGEGVFVRLDMTSGDILSTKSYAGLDTEALFYQQPTQDGNLILADHTHSAQTGTDIECWVQKINRTNGQVIWSKVYYRANDNIRGRIEKVNDGGFLLVPYDNFNTAQADALLAKIDANGNLLWSYNYGGNASDRLMKAVQTADGGFIAVGDTRSNSANGNSDILIVKTDAYGHVQGSCAKDGGIQSANFTTTIGNPEVTETNWIQSAPAQNAAPLPLNLLGQGFSPNASPIVLKNIPLCPNKSYKIAGAEYYAPKLVVDTVSNLSGCDTIFAYNLTLTPFNTGIHVIGLCPGESFTLDGVPYFAPTTVIDTLPSLTGDCDTLCTFVLKAWAQPTASQTIAFCPGESVMIGGQVYTQPGTVQAFVASATGGCDTLVTYTLIERPQATRSTTISFCPGESVLIGGNTYTQAGTVNSYLPSTTGGCDTLVTYTLILRPQPTRAETRKFCPGESVIIAGQSYDQSGTVIVNLASTNGGCDTIVTYTLELQPQPARTETRGLCPGESVTIAGQTYNQPGTVIANLASTNGGCDTIVTYTLELRPQPTRAETRGLCPGESVTIAGQTYNQPGTVIANLASTNGGCDTIVTYTLELRPQPTRAETRSFCPGESVTIAGQNYNQAGTVIANFASTNGGCDTIVTYTLELRPQPTRAETFGFCPGESVTIAGQSYHQPGTVIVNFASSTGGCDTVVTYTLQHLTPAPSNIAIHCPNDMTMVAVVGTSSMPVVYPEPLAASDCICPGLEFERTNGLASGSVFPIGSTQVIYTAKDNCGQTALCSFHVTVREEDPCDVKVNGCLKYELLSVTSDPAKNYTYRIRVTNSCSDKLIYTAIQIPDGLIAMEPSDNSTYTSPDGRNYLVRSPNFLPMYSVSFRSTADSIANGQSEVFEYTLPAQANVTYINITSRLATHVFYEAHLNTFNCSVGVTPDNHHKTTPRAVDNAENPNSLLLFPNPTSGVLYADLSNWKGQKLQLQVTNTQGQIVHSLHLTAEEDLLRVEMPQGLSSGVYFFELISENGEKQALRFMLQR